MPRRPHFGRPGTPVIPVDWETNMGRVIAATFNCTVTIGPAGTAATFNTDTRQTETTPVAPVYIGAADIGPAGITDIGGEVTTGDEQVDQQRLEVKIPIDSTAPVAVNHVVTVSASTNPALVGKRLVITDLERADRGFSRVFFAQLND